MRNLQLTVYKPEWLQIREPESLTQRPLGSVGHYWHYRTEYCDQSPLKKHFPLPSQGRGTQGAGCKTLRLCKYQHDTGNEYR